MPMNPEKRRTEDKAMREAPIATPLTDDAQRVYVAWLDSEPLTGDIEPDDGWDTARQMERDNAALRSALELLEQAYTNSHSPQHRAACLAEAHATLAKVKGTA